MRRRLFWMAVGVGTAVFVAYQGKKMLHKMTPEGVRERLEDVAGDLGSQVADFIDTFSEARREREAELSEQFLT